MGHIIRCFANVPGWAQQFHVVLNQYAVKPNGYTRRTGYFTAGVKRWRFPANVISLPLACFARSVSQRGKLLVQAACHAVNIGFVLVGIYNLRFITCITLAYRGQEQAAVSASLSFTGNVSRDAPFNMQLVAAERAFGFNVSG